MDIAAQVAVAAGMEALKSAGLVSGKSNDPSEWKLPEKYRDTTGVVYASSFPAMDAVSIFINLRYHEVSYISQHSSLYLTIHLNRLLEK